MDEKDIIEVEVLSETTEEKPVSQEPKKNVTYVSKEEKGTKFLSVARSVTKWSMPLIFFSAAFGFSFSILYSQNQSIGNLIFMIAGWSLSLLSLLVSVIAYLIGKRGLHLIQKDNEGN